MVMISDSSSFAPHYSSRESGNTPIQDRMRAMAIADSNAPVTQQPPKSAEDNQEVGIQTESRRTSVIDMWRQREMSLSSKALSKPIPLRKTSSDHGFRHTEEKKEPTLEEQGVDSESHDTVSIKRFSETASTHRRGFLPPSPSAPASGARKQVPVVSPSTPSWDQPTSRNSWREEEPVLEDGFTRQNGNVTVQSEEENPSTSMFPGASTNGIRSGSSSTAVHEKWEETEQEPEEPPKISPSTSPKRVPVTRAAPVTPGDSESPAFSDLKSKWAQFGAQKVQARVGTKVTPKVVSPMPHKVTPNNSLRNSRSLGRGCDESSIDGDVTASGSTQGQPNKAYSQEGTSPTVRTLQQPASQDYDADAQSEETEKTFKRKTSRNETSSPDDDDSPAKKVSTYMYMKGRPNMPSRVSQDTDEDRKNDETKDNTAFAPRLNALPKRMLQRKLLMDKQRRRAKGANTANSATVSSVSNDDDTLNEVFNKTYAENNDKFDLPLKRSVTDPMREDNPSPMIQSRLPIEILMAFGAEEDEFLAAESRPRKIATQSPFNQHQQQQQKQEEEYGYGVSRKTQKTDESESALPSLPSKSAIATRAQKTLREKRSRPKPNDGSPDRARVPLKEPNYGGTNPSPGYSEDEMMALDKERDGNVPPRPNRVVERSNRPSDEFKVSCGTPFWGGFQEPEPSATFDESVSASTTSHMLSLATSASDVTSVKDGHFGTARSRDSLLDGEDIVADGFVSESNSNVEAFTASFQSLSLAQIANDLKEEAGSVLRGVNFKKLSSDWNEGVAAASQSLGEATSRLNKLVGKDVFAKAKPHPTVPGRTPSPVEEIAIEVEYVEDSDDDGEI